MAKRQYIFIDLIGQVFGYLTVIHRMEPSSRQFKDVAWLCVCFCGKQKIALGSRLRNGDTRSCGCLKRESISQVKFIHGLSNTPEYEAWNEMRRRCERRTSISFRNYGARGITVCDRWCNSFEKFLADMGPRPGKGYSLDRIDNTKNYSPENCRWATKQEQNRNKRTNVLITYNGETKTLIEWAEITHLPYYVLRYRIAKLWSVERTLTQPVKLRSAKNISR